MVIINPNNVAFLVRRDDGVRKSLIDSDVLLKRGRLVKRFGLGSVGDRVMETWPENLVNHEIKRLLSNRR